MSAAATEPPPGTEAAMRGATSARPVPRLFPEELRTPPRPTHDRKKHCNPRALGEKLWAAEHNPKLTPEELAEKSRKLEEERQAIPRWELALNRRDAELKEAMRPFALKLAAELPGRIAQAINEIEAEDGVTGAMQFWRIGQAVDASVILHPLHRLHELAVGWRESLEKNDAEAQESLIRALLADSGALQPKVFVFRRY